MAFVDQLRDRATLQQSVETATNYGAPTIVWTNRASLQCSARQTSARVLQTYGRTGTEHGVTFSFDDRIPRVQGKNSLYDLLISPDQTDYRILFNTRTMTIIGTRKQSQGMHSTGADILMVDTVEAPERVGQLDAT